MKKIHIGKATYLRLRRSVKNVFGLSSSEANGLIILLPLLFVLTLSEPAWRWWKVKNWEPDPRDARKRDSLAAAWQLLEPASRDSTSMSGRTPVAYFRFDP